MSFASPTRERSAPSLPLAPMIDMMFLMLIFFLWTAAQRDAALDIPVELQQTEGGGPRRGMPEFVTIRANNEIYIAGRPYTLESARAALMALGAAIPGETPQQRAARIERSPIIIRGDKNSHLGTTQQIIGFARAAGLVVRMEAAKPNPE